MSYYLSNSRFEPATHWGAPYYERYFVPKAGVGVDVTAPLDHRPMFTAGIMRERFFTGIGHGGKCYSEDTEILTENGWKHFYELNGEKVATLNPQTHEIEYQTPVNFFEYDYKGKMFYQTGKSIDLLVTPNHNLYVSWLTNQGREYHEFTYLKPEAIGNGQVRDSKTGRFVKGEEKTKGRLKFKRNGKWNCTIMDSFTLPSVSSPVINQYGTVGERNAEGRKVPIDDWLRLLGIFLSEGSASAMMSKVGSRSNQTGRKGTHYVISITQNDDEKRKRIKDWIERVGKQVGFSVWEEKSNDHSKAVKFKSRQVYEYLSQLKKAKEKYIPNPIKFLPSEKLRLLIASMGLGDGFPEYSTSSKQLADDLQEIALKAGWGATISESTSGCGTKMYHISITTEGEELEPLCHKEGRGYVSYSGKVYCVEVPNHVVYVRRKGKACWCGNSVYTGDFYDKLIEVGGMHMDYVEGKTAKWLSCLTGAELGPAWMEKGGKIYHGYVKTYEFSLDPKYFPIPWRDPKAGLFFHPYINGLTALYKEETNYRSWRIERDGYLENAEKVEEDDPELADKLRREARIFKYFGDSNATWK